MLKNKVVIITGGSGLLGREFVKDARKKGAIAINADIDCVDDLDKFTIKLDITNPDSIKKCLQRVVSKFGKIDGFVNNAYPRTRDWGQNKFGELNHDSINANLQMQLSSIVSICQEVSNFMKPQKSGSIVNIASIYGVVGNDITIYPEGMNVALEYCAVKGGVINFTRGVASLLGRDNIRVNCVSPGGIFDNQNEVFVKNYENKVPMKRMGNPDDIAPSVSFLLSDESKYITGQNLVVDGGWTCI